MTKLIFITSGKIIYTLPGKDLYESITLTGKGKKFPNITKGGISEIQNKAEILEKLKPVAIYTAPTAQCLDTAKVLSRNLHIKIYKDDNLKPLRFDLNKIISRKEFEKSGEKKFDILRTRFLDKFYSNKLIDSNLEVEIRFNNFIKNILNEYNEKTVIVVSHAFIVKLFEIYHQIGKKMYTDKKTLFNLFKPEVETMKRLETLMIEV